MKWEIFQDTDEDQFVAYLDGVYVGEIMYMQRPEYLDIYHTGVAPEFEGMGMASKMATQILDYIRSQHLKIWVRCPYLSSFMKKHPEYEDLRYE